MGGGFGLSVHGSHRVVTERVLYAMPEVGIGLFPDVGGTWFLPRCPGRTGWHLALTTHRCDAADCLYTGYATHGVASENVATVLDGLTALTPDDWAVGPAGQVIDRLLGLFAADFGTAGLAEDRGWIDTAYATPDLDAILQGLDAAEAPAPAKAAATIRRMSPTSLMLTVEGLRRGAKLTYADCVTLEYRLTQACMAGDDFFEGIRALLIDKDKTPIWKPSAANQVSAGAIAQAFEPGEFEDLRVP